MTKPVLSVVIASCVGDPFISRCLRSLEGQRGERVEFIIVDRAGGKVADMLAQDFPWAKLIRRPEGRSVPDLRRDGLEVSKADYVAIIEEHCVAAENWIELALRCIDKSPAAVGGVVDDSEYDRLMDWAVYFTEYNAYMPPVERGTTYDICAANCIYRRDLLLKFLPEQGSGYWEAVVNRSIMEAGHNLQAEPDLIVRRTGPFTFFYYLGQRFLFSRAFGGIRRTAVPIWYRVAYVLLAPLLVPLLWFRTTKRVFAKGHRIDRYLLATPILIPVNFIYVLGEWVGYLAGPGDSLSRIE
jgi:glycosyltransferase involved in cell wall biosynthesis